MAAAARFRCNLTGFAEKWQLPVMDDSTLTCFIRQHIAAQSGQEITFVWQSDESTQYGLAYFQRVLALQKQHAEGRKIHNVFQTNGRVLEDDACGFFHENGWRVDLLLDVPLDLPCEKTAHHQVMQAIETLVKHGVELNVLAQVNHRNSQQPQRFYRYLRSLGTPNLQFIPVVECDENGKLSASSVTAEGWGIFLTSVFDQWVREDIGRVFVQLFDSTLGIWRGYPSQICAFSETCGQQKRRGLTASCRQCSVLRFCQGDCPKHRISDGKSALCAGYRHFFAHSAPHMKAMRDLLKQRRSPMELMVMLNQSR